MIIGKILWIKDFKPNLNIKMYLLCMVIALIIFLINSIFQMIFVKRLSITELIKSSLITEVGKGRIVIGTAYSMYSITERDISEKYPYDISFIENTKTNNISKGDLSIAVKASGGEIKEHKALECLNLPDYRVYEEKVILYIQKALISESNYNNHMGTNISLSKGEIVEVVNEGSNNKFKDSDIIINFNDLSNKKSKRL